MKLIRELLMLENYLTDILKLKFTVYVLHDDELGGMPDMYDGDDEELNHKLTVLNATAKQPYWLDEDDEKAIVEAINEFGEVDSYINEPEDEDDFPDLVIEIQIKDTVPDTMKMRGRGVSSYDQRQEVWVNLLSNRIEETLSARGRDMSVFDVNVDTHWLDAPDINESLRSYRDQPKGEPVNFSVDIFTSDEVDQPLSIDDLHDDAPLELRAKYQRAIDSHWEKLTLSEEDSRMIKHDVDDWSSRDEDQAMRAVVWDYDSGGVASASLYPHISASIDCYGSSPGGWAPGWIPVIKQTIQNAIGTLGKDQSNFVVVVQRQ